VRVDRAEGGGVVAPIRATTCKVCGAPRWEHAKGARCQRHWLEYQAEGTRKSKAAGAPSGLPDYQRITDYRAEAIRQGANEEESWWVAMAAEARYQREGRSSKWLVRFVAQELAWLRANASTLADLDSRKWGPVRARETVTIDDGGWSESEVA
jgi:hypothetical protein